MPTTEIQEKLDRVIEDIRELTSFTPRQKELLENALIDVYASAKREVIEEVEKEIKKMPRNGTVVSLKQVLSTLTSLKNKSDNGSALQE